MTSKNKWTHKVVKMQRGTDGKWFAMRAAGTFSSEAEACEYAESFAAEQRSAGVSTTRICVVARKGNRTVLAHNVNRADVAGAQANALVRFDAAV